MKKGLLLIAVVTVLLFTGCTSGAASGTSSSLLSSASAASSEISSVASSSKPSASFNVDWDKCISDTKASITSSSYSYVKDAYIKVDQSVKRITFTAALDDSTDPKVALSYADTMLRQFNMFAAQQDSTISSGTKTSRGGLYDVYQAQIGIAALSLSGSKDTSKWWVYDTVPALAQTSHEIKLQSAYR